MRIDELFDQPLPIEWKDVPGTYKTMRPATNAFFDVDGVTFKVSFIGARANPDPNLKDANVVSVTFGLFGRNHMYNSRNDYPTLFKHKTVSIFSTVTYAIDSYWKKENPDAMYFTPSANRQDKMYKKLIKYFNTTQPEYHIEQRWSHDAGDYYEITK